MKFLPCLSSFLVVLPLITQISAEPISDSGSFVVGRAFGRAFGGGKKSQNGGNQNKNASQNTQNAAKTNNNGNTNNDPQKSLTLDSKVIATGFANNGQDQPEAGQVPSLTSTNNFINFCLTYPNLPITNGKQIQTGSCNPAPIGAIPAVGNMPSAKFTFPANGGTIAANKAFTIKMAITNIETGNFVNAQQNYFAAPQQLNSKGQIIGHSHVVVEALNSLGQTTPTDPQKFAFFKGINTAAQNGVVTADVTDGLPSGAYRMCSINSSSNHQPAIVPVAQHGSLDDCVYFSVSANGGNNNNAASNTANGSTGTTAATGTAAKGTGKGAGKGRKGNKRTFSRQY